MSDLAVAGTAALVIDQIVHHAREFDELDAAGAVGVVTLEDRDGLRAVRAHAEVAKRLAQLSRVDGAIAIGVEALESRLHLRIDAVGIETRLTASAKATTALVALQVLYERLEFVEVQLAVALLRVVPLQHLRDLAWRGRHAELTKRLLELVAIDVAGAIRIEAVEGVADPLVDRGGPTVCGAGRTAIAAAATETAAAALKAVEIPHEPIKLEDVERAVAVDRIISREHVRRLLLGRIHAELTQRAYKLVLIDVAAMIRVKLLKRRADLRIDLRFGVRRLPDGRGRRAAAAALESLQVANELLKLREIEVSLPGPAYLFRMACAPIPSEFMPNCLSASTSSSLSMPPRAVRVEGLKGRANVGIGTAASSAPFAA